MKNQEYHQCKLNFILLDKDVTLIDNNQNLHYFLEDYQPAIIKSTKICFTKNHYLILKEKLKKKLHKLLLIGIKYKKN